jgi:hypothetical protein
MFNESSEIAIFDRVGLKSVFFGQTSISQKKANLMYMTVRDDMASRDKVWDKFRNDGEWKKLSNDPAFANVVSASTIVFLRPASYSQI